MDREHTAVRSAVQQAKQSEKRLGAGFPQSKELQEMGKTSTPHATSQDQPLATGR